MAIVTLRPYQVQAIEAVLSARRSGVRRMVVALPTGAGKTVIFAQLAALAKKPVLVLAHREELLTQAQQKLEHALAGQGIVAIEQSQRRAAADAKVVVASIRSLREERLQQVMRQRDFGLIIYDECHHAAADDNRRVLRQLGCFDRQWQGTLLGFTATTTRADGLGLDDIFEKIVYSRSLSQMIVDNYLVPLRGFRVGTQADLTNLSANGDDFAIEELAEAIDIDERNALVARSIQELARDRRTIAFCVTVGHARNLCKSLNSLGVSAGIVYGDMPRDRRAQALQDFRSNKIQVLTNVGVLTEGFDDPGVSCIAMARPTRSDGLYAQCVGRGTRLHADKSDCLVLDFVDLSALHLATLPTLFGMPRDIDLAGMDAREAGEVWQQTLFDYPAFELEAGAITLAEIQSRAAHFDPLTRQVDLEVRAISDHAWFSLGRKGLALHWQRNGKFAETLVLCVAARGRKYEVSMEGKKSARFSTLQEAVTAADWEMEQCGTAAWRSAQRDASWRRAQIPQILREQLAQLRPPQTALNTGEALQRLCIAFHAQGFAPQG